jgi:c-di-GMP-related signal transduction protein
MLFDNLLQQVYCNQNKGYTIILGDFNSRCGHFNDYIEGVDDIVPIVIDNTENLKGDLFIEFLRDINFAMLNGRIGVNDFTYISPRGRSVVDYICVPYEQFKYI